MNLQANKSSQKVTLLFLLLGIMFLGMNKPLLKLLIDEGGPLSIKNPNAISFCNVLFVGNLLAGLLPLFFYGVVKTIKEILNFSLKTLALIICVGVLNTLIPSLVFYALIHNSVTNVVLILQLETVFYAFLVFFIIRGSVTKQELFGYGFIALGTVVLLFTTKFPSAIFISLPFIAAFFDAVLSLIARKILNQGCSVPTLLFCMNIFSAVVFFVIVMLFFGIAHFEDLFEPGLWLAMLVYAVFGIIIAASFWLNGIKRASPRLVANVALSFPFFAILFAYLFVKEIPSVQQIISFVIIIFGMIISRIGSMWGRKGVRVMSA